MTLSASAELTSTGKNTSPSSTAPHRLLSVFQVSRSRTKLYNLRHLEQKYSKNNGKDLDYLHHVQRGLPQGLQSEQSTDVSDQAVL